MRRKKPVWQIVLLICVLGLVLVNLLIAMKLASKIDQIQSCPQKRKSLPCEAIPIKFAVQEPQCANKLLRAMNVTNVNFLPDRVLNQLLNRTSFHLRNLSEQNK